MTQEVTVQDFTRQVKEAGQPVLVDFHAPWCGPCKLVSPILEEIAGERRDLKVVKVDVDQNPTLAQEHRVMGVSTLILYREGKPVASWVGLRPKPALIKEIDQALGAT